MTTPVSTCCTQQLFSVVIQLIPIFPHKIWLFWERPDSPLVFGMNHRTSEWDFQMGNRGTSDAIATTVLCTQCPFHQSMLAARSSWIHALVSSFGLNSWRILIPSTRPSRSVCSQCNAIDERLQKQASCDRLQYRALRQKGEWVNEETSGNPIKRLLINFTHQFPLSTTAVKFASIGNKICPFDMRLLTG